MNKQILIISGSNKGKTEFDRLAKSNGVWCWNLNFFNLLKDFALKVGWDGKKSKEYFDFIIELNDLTTKYFDSKRNHATTIIEKFLKNDRVNLLVLHGYEQENVMIEEFCNKYNAKTLHIYDEISVLSIDKNFDYELTFGEPSFEEGIKNILGI